MPETLQNRKKESKKSWIVYPALALFGLVSFLSGYLFRGTLKPQEQETATKIQNEQKYEEFLKQPNALDFKREIGDAFSKEYAGAYLDLLRTGRAIELVKKLGPDFSNYNVPYYARLLEKGVKTNNIANLDSNAISEVLRNIDEIPKDLLEYIGSPRKQSIEAANSNPIFGTDEKKVRDYIKQKLKARERVSRENADYSQDISQIDSVSNINILYNLKGYVDFFDDANNLKQITNLINNDSNDIFSEHGGFVFSKEGKYEFRPITSIKNKLEKNMENNQEYVFEPWMRYIGAIGYFHIHASKEDNSPNAGPSGSRKSLEDFFKKDKTSKLRRDYPLADGDFTPLSDLSNPYRVECVLTRLRGGKFCADVYFYDKDTQRAYVLGLGVYDLKEEK